MDRAEPRRLDMTTATTTTTTRRPRALLLDDDVTVLSLLLDELLELDVVVSALELPRRSGRALVELIRKAGGERDLGLVLLGGATDDATKADLLRLGADMVVERTSGP